MLHVEKDCIVIVVYLDTISFRSNNTLIGFDMIDLRFHIYIQSKYEKYIYFVKSNSLELLHNLCNENIMG